MASSRKKQDELNLKTLRELAALPQNKFCFDCGQRGPTYVNVTVGSFVCTKCSGILRGITPPHRVKSISMATFTPEEIDTIRNKGNDHCRNVWLGLYEGTPRVFSDEQQVRDFMLEKYERKRYYIEVTMTKPEVQDTRPWTTASVNGTGKLPINGTKNGLNKNPSNAIGTNGMTNGMTRSRPEVKNLNHQNGLNNNLGNSFAVDFDNADIFSNTSSPSSTGSQNGFADFEHNQVYNANSSSSTNNAKEGEFSIFDLHFSSLGPTLNQVPLFPKCTPSNRWSMPPQSNLNAWPTQPTPVNVQNGTSGGATLASSTPPAAQDKYAALKDLDNEMKQQQHQDMWSTSNTGSTGSLYSSSTPNTGSLYGSPSPQGSIFGSPSQDSQVPNPFGNGNPASSWTNNGFTTSNGFSGASNGFNNNLNGMNGTSGGGSQTGYANPFREQLNKGNGLFNGFQPVFPSNTLTTGSTWGGNPFKQMGAVTTSTNPNNPFL
ncbi:arf-GAP domain and FG repeat-containing protein 1 isoform X2 [Euwallacea fornicatus]|uniref:arf-GAP domain and FG repeat-containing protein 1 isoform X2 n=1 Tax=Euwallacea fornicatus TaxID=995702 RepID=UPI00339015C6